MSLIRGYKRVFWLKKWGFDRIGYNSNHNIYWGLDRNLRSWEIDQNLSQDLKNKFSLNIEHTSEYKAQDDERFEKDSRNYEKKLSWGITPENGSMRKSLTALGGILIQTFNWLRAD